MTIFCIENVHFLKNQRWEFIKENKKVRTQEEKKENKNSTKKTIKKKRKFSFFSDAFLVERVLSLIAILVEFLFSYLLVFFYKFPPQEIIVAESVGKTGNIDINHIMLL